MHQACGRNGKRHQQRRPTHPPPRERTGLLRIAMMVVMMAMVMTGMAVIVTSVVVVIV
ncbi:hypothetical protein AK973_0065 [Pseudomonas brassicacearum]|uniref:Uncharacterized protein n=1 Tax=Pseudomonas brassicacearum (strain NFM421) TaxID=994484 RepID=F2K777_PSEBN|nr:Hypothetical protein PSEBR_gl124 [Pseudomonas brassicacearum subsp. brassicacearum NFM421]ALQ00514.1 hypothetical protein AK973_0065 [Pseudomonas brassicacearum]